MSRLGQKVVRAAFVAIAAGTTGGWIFVALRNEDPNYLGWAALTVVVAIWRYPHLPRTTSG